MRADDFGIGCPFEASPDDWMLVELEPGHLQGATGATRWPAAFDAL